MTLDDITYWCDRSASELRIRELQITTTNGSPNEQSEAYRAAWDLFMQAREAVELAGKLESLTGKG